MKRFIAIILVLVFIFSVSLISSAHSETTNTVYVGDITVEFGTNSIFNHEEQQMLATYLVNNKNSNTSASTYNLLCTLLGHNTTTESVTIIEHCVSDTAPRCLRTIQEVTVCTRCETVIDTNIISKVYVFCCD